MGAQSRCDTAVLGRDSLLYSVGDCVLDRLWRPPPSLASPLLAGVSLVTSGMHLHPSSLGSSGTFSERPFLTSLLDLAALLPPPPSLLPHYLTPCMSYSFLLFIVFPIVPLKWSPGGWDLLCLCFIPNFVPGEVRGTLDLQYVSFIIY